MAQRKAPPWSRQEIAILDDVFPREGINGAAEALADRSWQAINVMASKRGLRSPVVGNAPEAKLQGDRLEAAIRMREVDGWSFARIGATLGVCEASACNSVLIAMCPRKGFTPAQRDEHGHLTVAGLDRLRLMLRKGMKGVDIQLQLGVSAACVAEQRRRYRADLKARGMRPLPPPGGGQRYSGVLLSRDEKREVERLLLEGFGAKKVTQQSGVSNTSVGRIRNRLIKRLARKGECLPGCDKAGRRIGAPKASDHFVPDVLRVALKERLMAREPVSRAARSLGISGSTAYDIRDELVAELAGRGEQLQPRLRLTRHATRIEEAKAAWLPAASIARFRLLAIEHGIDQGKAILMREMAEARAIERARPKTFEDQLAAVRAGAGLVRVIPMRRPDPTMTLGGIASAAI